MRLMTNEWLKAASDDLLSIEKLIVVEHLSHIVAFHAQQAIEKSFKSLFEEFQIEIPKIHKLINLHKILEEKIKDIDEIMLYRLDQLYIESRYPGDLGLLPNGKPTREDAKMFYDFAILIFSRICDLLGVDKNEYLHQLKEHC